MAIQSEKFGFEVKDSTTGLPLSGATVELREGSNIYTLTELGTSAYYVIDSIPTGKYEAFINSVGTGQTFGVGTGQISALGNEANNVPVSSASSYDFQNPTELKTTLSLDNVNNVAVPVGSPSDANKVIQVDSNGDYTLATISASGFNTVFEVTKPSELIAALSAEFREKTIILSEGSFFFNSSQTFEVYGACNIYGGDGLLGVTWGNAVGETITFNAASGTTPNIGLYFYTSKLMFDSSLSGELDYVFNVDVYARTLSFLDQTDCFITGSIFYEKLATAVPSGVTATLTEFTWDNTATPVNIPTSAEDGAFVLKNSDGSYLVTDNSSAPKLVYDSVNGVFLSDTIPFRFEVETQQKNVFRLIDENDDEVGQIYGSNGKLLIESTTGGERLDFTASNGINFNSPVNLNGATDTTGGTLTANDPTLSQHVATKNYVDNAIPSTPNLQQVTDQGNITTNAIIATSFNGAAITSVGGGTNFLADDGTYKAVSGGGASEGGAISGATANRLVTTDASGNLNTANAPSWDPSGTDTILNLPNTLANGAILGKTIDTGWLGLLGGTSETNAASIRLYGSGTLGSGRLRYNGTTRLLWDGTNIDASDLLRALNGLAVTGNVDVSGELVGSAATFNIRSDSDAKSLNLIGGSTTTDNVSLALLNGGVGRMRYNGITEALWGDGYFSINNILKMASTTNSSPTNGDIWFDGTNLKGREGGATFNLNGGGGGVTPGSWTTATLQSNWEARSGYRAARYRDNGIDGTEIEGVVKLKASQFLLAGGSVVLFTLPTALRPNAKLTGLVSCTYEGSWQAVTGVWYEVNTSGQVEITNSSSTLISELYNIGINIRFAQT